MSIRSGKSAGRTETPPPPTIPPRSRLRSYSSPAVESMVERIAGAMIEMEKLQADIDSVVERQSLYANSRPSTVCRQDFEPMPSIPATPSAAPSFAERLSTERPKTAPPRNSTPISPITEEGRSTQPSIVPAPLYLLSRRTEMVTPTNVSPKTPPMAQSQTSRSSELSMLSAASVVSAATAATKAKAAASAWTGSRINGRPIDVPLAPPLPLVLRPPLRKKKSFSRVSNWLFPGDSGHNNASHQQMHKRGMSFDSVTNLPRPVTDKDGYYQCVLPPTLDGRTYDRTSMDTALTVDTLSTWTTERENERGQTSERQTEIVDNGMEEDDYEYGDEDQTILTDTWSPSSSPVTSRQETATTTPSTVTTMTPVVASALATEKASNFGNGILSRPQSVGVAF
ncbi:hypothetical protein CMQ_2950 [Grosmannia clavigera kw1407]|uniref:Uncharacterized protein n=1 Tax=Grosmannia clavigera (strain kw1407 / UAMH 11150) TaxID=655863 RepID=F0XGW3_GROCL|nr:uncharacterized protein CMQ_2950 [Grosmannia clavigera kw1407]EFX03021.1 hypothetical protein CMQ_2950 [Grosmannia clavigera kw1407]